MYKGPDEDTYILVSWDRDTPVEARIVSIPGYDGDRYGDTVPFTLGSNQMILAYDEAKPQFLAMADPCLETRMATPEATTAAMVALECATKVLGKPPYTGGCRAFYTYKEWGRVEPEYHKHCTGPKPDLVIVYDGGEFADLLNSAYERDDLREAFLSELKERGYKTSHRYYYSGLHKIKESK